MKTILACAFAVLCAAAVQAAPSADLAGSFIQWVDHATRGETIASPQELEAMLKRAAADESWKGEGAQGAREFIAQNYAAIERACQGEPGCQSALRAAYARLGAPNAPRPAECKPASEIRGGSRAHLDNIIACAAKGDGSVSPKEVEAAMTQLVASGDFVRDLKSAYVLYIAIDRNYEALNKACQGQPGCQEAVRAAYLWTMSQKFAQGGNREIVEGLRYGVFGMVHGFLRSMASAGDDYRKQSAAWDALGDSITHFCGGGLMCRLKAYVVVSRAKEAWYGPAASEPDNSPKDPDMTIWGR